MRATLSALSGQMALQAVRNVSGWIVWASAAFPALSAAISSATCTGDLPSNRALADFHCGACSIMNRASNADSGAAGGTPAEAAPAAAAVIGAVPGTTMPLRALRRAAMNERD